MIDLNPRAQALVESVRATESPSDRDKARIRRRVLARVAAATLASAAGTASSEAPASVGVGKATASVAATKATLAGVATSVFVAGAVAVGWVSTHDVGETNPVRWGASTVASAEATVAPRPPAPSIPAYSEVVPAPRETSIRPRGRAGSTLEQELPLLQSAQEALRGGDTDRALGLLETHAKRFPDGMLAQERRAVHAMAVCRKNGRAAGRAEADEFLLDAPASPLAQRVRAVCSLEPAGTHTQRIDR
jgi:hypothetical protein